MATLNTITLIETTVRYNAVETLPERVEELAKMLNIDKLAGYTTITLTISEYIKFSDILSEITSKREAQDG